MWNTEKPVKRKFSRDEVANTEKQQRSPLALLWSGSSSTKAHGIAVVEIWPNKAGPSLQNVLFNLRKTWMQYINYYPLYKLLKKYKSMANLSMQLKTWNVTLITGVLSVPFFKRNNTNWEKKYPTENANLSSLWLWNTCSEFSLWLQREISLDHTSSQLLLNTCDLKPLSGADN